MQSIKISPIFYMGNKKRLILDGLIDLFPEHIYNYYEPFAGSCIVAMNVRAKHHFVNDINAHLFDLYNMFANYNLDTIITHINNRIEQFELPRERTKRNVYTDKETIEKYKQSYFKFRDYYNDNPNILDFYTLNFFSFSQQFRFNAEDKYNMPFGSDCYTEQHNNYIKNGIEFFSRSTVNLFSSSFDDFLLHRLNLNNPPSDNSFIYFDPPYLSTTAVYNESRDMKNFTWDTEWETKLRDICLTLTSNGIKWGMSNVFKNKDFYNESLMNWATENSYYVYHFKDHSYIACGKGNANTDEVYISNYPLKHSNNKSNKLF